MADTTVERERNKETYRALMHKEGERDTLLRVYNGTTSLLLDILHELREINEKMSKGSTDA